MSDKESKDPVDIMRDMLDDLVEDYDYVTMSKKCRDKGRDAISRYDESKQMSDRYEEKEREEIADWLEDKDADHGNRIAVDSDVEDAQPDFPAESIGEGTTWTSEYPTKPGFYWIRNDLGKWQQERGEEPDPGAQIVWLDQYGDIYFTADEVPARIGTYGGELITAEWYGPIEPPE